MPRFAPIALGAHFERYVARQIRTGRFRSRSEVVRAALHLLEQLESAPLPPAHAAARNGESFTIDDVLNEAREEAGASPIDG